jgi:ribosomal protein S12 methylthiotransferase
VCSSDLLNNVDGIRWIRLLYCYPNFVTDELLDAIAVLPQVTKYIDMPLQHADDDILRAMRRERSGAALRRILDRIRKRVPGIALRSSFIVGFPGETDEAFERLMDFIREQEFDRVGVFTYSLEENTGAFELPDQVPERIKRARRARLMELQGEISLKKNRDLIGCEIEVLVEGAIPGRATRMRGRSQSQAPEIDGSVFLRGEAAAGEFVRVRIDKALTYDLSGRVKGADSEEEVASHA